MLHDGAHRFGFRNRVAEAFVDDHLDADTFVLQRLSQLVSIGDSYATIEFAMLNERRRARVLDVGNWRGLLVDHRIVHRILSEIVNCERRDVRVVVISGRKRQT